MSVIFSIIFQILWIEGQKIENRATNPLKDIFKSVIVISSFKSWY